MIDTLVEQPATTTPEAQNVWDFIDVLKHLKEMPQIIFSTAYDQYALNAFEVNAVDYLLKPYTKERFAKAIEKVLDEGADHLNKLKHLAENLIHENLSTSYPVKILVSVKNKLVVVDTQDIIWRST